MGMVSYGGKLALRAALTLDHVPTVSQLAVSSMRVLAFGSRDWPFPGIVTNHLSSYYIDTPQVGPDPFKLITGGARGVDTIAEEWAEAMNVWSVVYKADWNQYGKSAGPIRNQRMIDEENPTYFLGFILNNSKGSQDMLHRLQREGIPGEVVYAYS